ncbi:MAG: metal-dependent hydrolase [Acidimicrobiales bacterium]|nr:metal-dependent hydrolase [Acidimicrobiales bacterium]
MSFYDSLADLPKHFANGDLINSHIIASLSSVFPDGEDFFVRSVRHFRDQITDPVLKRQVAGFIGQEAIHGREHRAFNDRLHELGYPTKKLEQITKRTLAFRERHMSPTANLATTAALEHFTATLAEILLRDEDARELIGSPAVTDVFLWHAFEECEHKAVAFDVYKAVGGSERTRRWTMNFICFSFIGGMSLQTLLTILRDRDTYRRDRLIPSLRQLRHTPFLRRSVWHKLRDFNRPDFHPDDHETNDLLAEWQERLFGPNGELTTYLAGTA